jgi:formate hydrogenlyase subunit 3/multisubunit Na+/H+ antiporter MnhD subunit
MATAAVSFVSAGTPGGLLLAAALLLPFAGVLASLVLGGRWPARIALAALLAGLPLVWALGAAWLEEGGTIAYALGGWMPPLGIALRADGLSVTMLATTVVVMLVVAVYARADFATPPGRHETRAAFSFWTLLLATWGSLNLLFLASDLFTLYVGLEVVTFAAVPLVSLDGRAETLQAALRYLLFALAGSILYLAGAVVVYGVHGTLDIALLAERTEAGPAMAVAVALMTVGLAAKTALFPLHLWLPPAHAGAPAAASALLSALVIKGSFFLVVRLWIDAMPAVPGAAAAQLLAALGAGAILVGSVVALRQARLKLAIAYSTVAQIGYLFLMFPLAFDAGAARFVPGIALAGGMLQAVAHATAKAAMFMAAGLLYAGIGHDRIAGLAGAARALPVSVAAFAVAGVSLVGLPPSGGFLAKWWLLSAAVGTGQWWWAVVIGVGGLLTAAYVLLVLVRAMQEPAEPLVLQASVARHREFAALALAVLSAALGLVALVGIDAAAVAEYGAR